MPLCIRLLEALATMPITVGLNSFQNKKAAVHSRLQISMRWDSANYIESSHACMGPREKR